MWASLLLVGVGVWLPAALPLPRAPPLCGDAAAPAGGGVPNEVLRPPAPPARADPAAADGDADVAVTEAGGRLGGGRISPLRLSWRSGSRWRPLADLRGFRFEGWGAWANSQLQTQRSHI
jgi:hypothetical protein